MARGVRPRLEGRRFGRLLVESRAVNGPRGRTQWSCMCDCGTKCVATSKILLAGHKNSCGCLSMEVHADRARELMTTHGRSRTALFQRWQTMISRCHNPAVASYRNYGGRGIAVCREWRESFERFAADVGAPPFGMTLERKDNDRSYEPGNVCWATRKEQARNTRVNCLVAWSGKVQPLAAWAEELGVPRVLLKDRLRLGWSVDRAMTESVRTTMRRNAGGERPLV